MGTCSYMDGSYFLLLLTAERFGFRRGRGKLRLFQTFTHGRIRNSLFPFIPGFFK